MTIRIVIADDHDVVRQGLRMFLGLDPELEVVGEAANGAEALALAKELHPDVVLMDLLMPVMDGIAATSAIRKEVPESEVLALTSVLEDASVTGAVRAGAIGYLLKDTQADELRRAIKAAAAGQVQVSQQALGPLMRSVRDAREATSPEHTDAELRTILIADIRGYTDFAYRYGDELAAKLVAKLAAVAREEIGASGGDVVEIQGDEVVAVFTSARHAMRAALQLQSRFEKETQADPNLPMHVGIGLDAGEVIPAGGGYSGRALILASRLCSIAQPGEVLASEGVVHLAGRTEGLDYVNLGEVQLKGFSEIVRATRIVAQG